MSECMTAALGATSMVDGRGQSRIIAGFAVFFIKCYSPACKGTQIKSGLSKREVSIKDKTSR